MIKIEDVSFGYDKLILSDINLEIQKKKTTFIIGLNGAGKSTLVNIISGILFPKKGKVFIDDLELNKKLEPKKIRKKIGMVLQNPDNQILFPKVYDDLEFGLLNIGVSETKEIIEKNLKKINMLDFIDANSYKLSGGEKQKIAIASQLVLNPDYLVFDEATSMLDSSSKKEIYGLIKKLKKDMGIIFVTNNLEELIYADDIIIIDEKKVYKYSILDLIKNHSIFVKHHLEIPFIFKIASLLNIDEISEERILDKLNG